MKGHQSEEIVARYLEDLGWNVAVPRDPRGPYDLIAESADRCRRVEVKPGKLIDGEVRRDVCPFGSHTGGYLKFGRVARGTSGSWNGKTGTQQTTWDSLKKKRADWLALVDRDGSVVILNLHKLLSEHAAQEQLSIPEAPKSASLPSDPECPSLKPKENSETVEFVSKLLDQDRGESRLHPRLRSE